MQGAISKKESRIFSKIKFGIGPRLFSAFGFVSLMTVLIGVVSWYGLDHLSYAQKKLAIEDVPEITASLKLSEQISALASSAPLLISVSNTQQRSVLYENLQQSVQNASQHVAILEKFVDDTEMVQKISDKLSEFPDLLLHLNQIVQKRSEYAEQRFALLAKLPEYRRIVEKESEPLLFKIRLDVLDKVGDIEMHFIEQQGLLEFKNSTNVLIGMLTEGASGDSLEEVDKVESLFLSSLGKITRSLGDLKRTSVASKFANVFQGLAVLGNKASETENIFTLRRTELNTFKEAQEIVASTRLNAQQLSQLVQELVAGVEQTINLSLKKNEKDAQNITISLMGIVLTTLLLSLLIGWLYVGRNLVQRLLVLVAAMKKIAAGDLNVSIKQNGFDEISTMATALETLRLVSQDAENLKKQQEFNRNRRLAEKKKNAEILVDKFNTSVGHSISSLAETAGTMQNQANEMKTIADHSAKEVGVMTTTTQAMTQDISTVASATDELSTSVSEIAQLAEQSKTVSSKAVERAVVMNNSITELYDGSQKIEAVLGLIKDIADQTNLLALNATIEAHRAGDAGRGFAIVAAEVKNLSHQTATAIDQISSIISIIQMEVKGTVSVAADIDHIIQEIDDIAVNIASAVEEQAMATQEISQSVTVSSENCQEILMRVNDVSDAFKQSVEAMTLVLLGAEKVDTESTHLDSNVAVFLDNIREN